MIHTKLDELFAYCEGHESLHRLSRQIELLGNVILGSSADKIEPSCLCCIISAFITLLYNVTHKASLAQLAKPSI